jgi:hypothetical protein
MALVICYHQNLAPILRNYKCNYILMQANVREAYLRVFSIKTSIPSDDNKSLYLMFDET